MPKETSIPESKKEEPVNEVVCVVRYKKEQFIEKGIQATPLATEFRWSGNRVPMPRGASCRVIQTLLKASL